MHSTQPLYPFEMQERMKNFMFLTNKYLYDILRLTPESSKIATQISKHSERGTECNSDVSRDFFGRPTSTEGLGREGVVMPPYGSRAKPWWGSGSKSPGSSKDFVP